MLKIPPPVKAFAVTGEEGLSLLREYVDQLEAMAHDSEVVQREFEEQMQRRMAQHRSALQVLWTQLAVNVGLDPEVTWANPEYNVEPRYLDQGFGAIVHTPTKDDPLNRIFGLSEDDGNDSGGPAGPPKGTMLN